MLSLLTLSCGSEAARSGGDPPSDSSRLGEQVCASRPAEEVINWSQALIDSSTVAASLTLSGITADDERAWGFDPYQGQIAVADLGGETSEVMGRLGRGPGEISARGRGWAWESPPAHWVDMGGDSIVVFDGLNASYFTTDGRFLTVSRGIRTLRAGLSFVSRVRLFRTGILIDVERRDGPASNEGRRAALWYVADDTAQLVHELALPPLPRDSRGALHAGPREARSRWDMHDGCVARSDGGSPWLLVGPVSTPLDTVRIPLDSSVPDGQTDAETLISDLGNGRTALPQPALVSRVRDLVADRDGWVWLNLGRLEDDEGGGVLVMRVSLESHEILQDTVPEFPRVFVDTRSFLALPRNGTGTSDLVMYRAR